MKTVFIIVAAIVAMIAVTLLPFLPGAYDQLAVPITVFLIQRAVLGPAVEFD